MERLQSGDENLIMYISCRDYKMKTLRSCETEQSCQVFWFCWGIFVGFFFSHAPLDLKIMHNPWQK